MEQLHPVDAALTLVHRHHLEYGPGFSDHAPMVIDALDMVGRDDLIDEWVAGYLPRLDALGGRDEPDESRWVAHFEALLDASPWQSVASTAIGGLADATAAAAGHGLLRTSHAVGLLRRAETPERLAELARGLAYWQWRAERLPIAEARGERRPHEVLAQRHHRSVVAGGGMITDRVRAVASADFVDDIGAVALEARPWDALTQITTVAAECLASGPASGTFALLHGLTSSVAARSVVDLLSADDAARLVVGTWTTVAALWEAFGDDEPLRRLPMSATPRPIVANWCSARSVTVMNMRSRVPSLCGRRRSRPANVRSCVRPRPRRSTGSEPDSRHWVRRSSPRICGGVSSQHEVSDTRRAGDGLDLELFLERFGWRCVEKVERRSSVHLDRRPPVMGQHKGGSVERRVLAPPASPRFVALPARRSELAGAHDLRSDSGSEAFGQGVVDATPTRVVFFDLPAVFDLHAMLNGETAIYWAPERGTRIGVLDRGAPGESVRWIETDPFWVFHFLNGYDEPDGSIAVTGCRAERLNTSFGDEELTDGFRPTLHRWRLDADRSSFTTEQLDDRPTDFPRLNDGWTGLRNRFGYSAHAASWASEEAVFDGVTKYDLETGDSWTHVYGSTTVCGETVFAADPSDSAEDAGWLLNFVHDLSDDRSSVVVLDARTLDEVTRVLLPRRVPFGFHGNFLPAT